MNSLLMSQLFDETTFYSQFQRDLKACRREVIIESPYITLKRASGIINTLEQLVSRFVAVYIITRQPEGHDIKMKAQAEKVIQKFESMGIQVFVTSNFSHRKLAILDRKILWEGSLNILSQTQSREIMRRIDSKQLSQECFDFVGLGRFIK